MEIIQEFFKHYYEYFFLVVGIFFCIAAWKDWNWVFEPPYNSIKNPIGFWFGRKAYRFSWMCTGIMVIGLSFVIIYSKTLITT